MIRTLTSLRLEKNDGPKKSRVLLSDRVLLASFITQLTKYSVTYHPLIECIFTIFATLLRRFQNNN